MEYPEYLRTIYQDTEIEIYTKDGLKNIKVIGLSEKIIDCGDVKFSRTTGDEIPRTENGKFITLPSKYC